MLIDLVLGFFIMFGLLLLGASMLRILVIYIENRD